MSGIIQGLIASLKTAAAAVDNFFYSATLLLNTSTTNGAQNSTFLDSSANNATITRNGTATQGTFSPFSQTGWSSAFNTSTTYLTVTDTAGLRFGSGNFTIEAWVYRSASGAVQTIASKGAATPTGWVFQISAADKLVFTDTSTSITGATSLAANTWYYVAVVRAGTGASQTTLYLNAASDATGTSATNFNQTSNMLIGADRSSTNFANGFISNLRLSNTARTITASPTSAFTADANTIFLTLHINNFQYTDSTAALTTMAVTGTPSVQAFSPFAPAASYSTSVVGGSGYFDGAAGTYLSIPNNTIYFINGDFTVEFWAYRLRTATATNEQIVGQARLASGFEGWHMQFTPTTNLVAFTARGGTGITSTSAPASNQWIHVAVTRASGTSYLFINGVLDTSNVTSNVSVTTGVFAIAAGNDASRLFNGYLSNLRIIKGQALSTTSFTPPTAPIQSDTDVAWTGSGVASSITGAVSITNNFTNSGIFDATSKNDAQTVGNAQVSTTQAKFGTTSMSFDGTGDWLLLPNSVNNQLGTGDFTIDGWVYLNATGVAYGVVSKGTGSTGWSVNVTSGNKLQFSYTATALTGATSLAANTWYYFAVVRSGSASGNLKLYLDASLDATSGGAVTDNFNQTSVLYVGADRVAGAALNGYLDEVRVTKSARTITLPTAAFPTK